MKIDNVYFCTIGVINKSGLDYNKNFIIEGETVKQTLAYQDKDSKWHDLFTKEIYTVKNISSSVGDLYIDLEEEIIPFREMLNTDKKNMSKKKIKKSFNEKNNQNTNE